MSCTKKSILDNAIKLPTLIHMPNSSLLNNKLWYTPVSARNRWMKATAVSVIEQKLQCCLMHLLSVWLNSFCIFSVTTWTLVCEWSARAIPGGKYIPFRQQMQEQNERLDQKTFSGSVRGPCAGGYLESQNVANSRLGSSVHGWTHQVGCPELSCRAFCIKQQQLLEFIVFWIILKTVQSDVHYGCSRYNPRAVSHCFHLN